MSRFFFRPDDKKILDEKKDVLDNAQNTNGVSMTALAFEHELGMLGKIFLIIAVLTFAFSTMFGYSFYGRKCVSYLFGTKAKYIYNWVYVIMIVVASVASLDIAINFVDSDYA